MYEYESETLDHLTMNERLAQRGIDGWRMAEAVVHPTETVGEQPKIIVFWEREIA